MRFYYRTGRRSAISMPLWLALIGYVVWASMAIAVALAVVVVVAGMAVLLLLSLLGELVLGRVRRRRRSSS